MKAVLRREWQRLRADPWDLAMLTWIPVLLCALTWWIFAGGIARDVPVALVDLDRSSLSRSFERLLDAAPGVAVRPAADHAEALSLLRQRRVYGIVVVPEGFQRDVYGGGRATVQWQYNGQFSAHVGGLGRDVRAVVSTLSAGIELTARQKRGASAGQARVAFEPIQLRLATLFNENGNNESFLVLAVLPSLLQIFIALAAVVAIGRELRQGTVPQWLAAAGGSWGRALAGKLAIPAACFIVQALAFVAFFGGVRGWAVQGSGAMLVAGLVLLVLAYLAAGALIVAATLGLRNGLSICAFYTAPAFAFTGQGFPLSSMPAAARAWAEALPLTHYLQLQSRHWLAGAPASYGADELLALAAFVLVFGGAAWFLLSQRALRPEAWGRT